MAMAEVPRAIGRKAVVFHRRGPLVSMQEMAALHPLHAPVCCSWEVAVVMELGAVTW